jgi:hypothetical protein
MKKTRPLGIVHTYMHVSLPLTSVQIWFSGAGDHNEAFAHTEVMVREGRYPPLHPYETVAPTI